MISGAQVQQALQGREKQIVELVEATYRLHGAGDSVNPPSYFLRFPDRPSSRIIALPASIGGQVRVDGLKWISSFPENVAAGHPAGLGGADPQRPRHRLPVRLPGELDHQRHPDRRVGGAGRRLAQPRPARARRGSGSSGSGLIARYIHTFLAGTGWSFDEIGVHDLSADSAAGFRGYLEQSGTARPDHRARQRRAADPLQRPGGLRHRRRRSRTSATCRGSTHNPLVLHVSLRDLAPEILLASTNIVDDVEHCLKANTSPHLAEQLTGNRDFLHGTLDDVMAGRVTVPADRPVVFSPFGLGVLDLAVGKYVYDEVARAGELHVVDDFFHELRRYG